MLRTIAAVLLGLWLLGLLLDVVGALIHVVLVIGLIVLAVKLFARTSKSLPAPDCGRP